MTVIMIISLICALMLGLFMGGAYFSAIWWGSELFASGKGLPTTIALMTGRFLVMAAVLAVVAVRGGALPLLATTLGIAIARRVVLRWVKATSS